MFNRYFGVILIIVLAFLVIPTSFAVNDNSTDCEIVNSDFTDDIIINGNDEIHVDINVDGDGDGSFERPFSSIGKAIDMSSNHSKIIIHEGIYKENNLNITKSVEICSNGNVIIDAENSSRIFTINTNPSDEVILSGITFINGRAYQGGAIFVRNAITTIDNSKFINNTALTEGGAIYWNALNGKVTNTIFEDNYARDGAAVSWGGSDSENIFGIESDYGEVTNCTFDNNHIMQDEDACIGLSVYADYVKVLNSKFINHYTKFNSSFGVLYINGDYARVSNCSFENNSFTMAGALGLDGNFAEAYNNVFINNTLSYSDSFGGAIGIQSENANIYNNTFVSNGGINCVGGAIFINTVETFSFNFINIRNNIFKDNIAYRGGGIYTTGKSNMLTLKILNNVFDGGNSINGSAIYLTDIYNPSIIENNNFSNLISSDIAEIYATHCILQLNNNLVANCTSENGGFIYTDGEVRSEVFLKLNDILGAQAGPTTLTAELYDDMNNTISSMLITFTINGEIITGKKGMNNLTSTFYETGNYNISGLFNSPYLNVENGVLTIIKGANLNVSNIVNYGKNVDIEITLTDSDNNTLEGKDVIVNINENNYLLTTDKDGKSQINLNLDYKIYNATATLNEEDYYNVIKQFSVTVLQSVNASDMKRAYKSDYDFAATFFNKDGSPLNNSEITFIVNNKEYSLKTDENGTAKITNLPAGYYIVNIINPITQESISKNLEIVKRITGNSNVNMYFGAGKYYKVRVYSDDGNAAGAGEKVKFTINGKSYTRYTNSNGYASFKITLAAKSYTIKATYNGVTVSNKIVVKPVLTAKNISKKKAKTIKFQAKLVNSKGKVLKNKKITFKIKGKTYAAKTNSKGIATLSLKNLKVGKYTITSKYGKSTVKNTIKIKK